VPGDGAAVSAYEAVRPLPTITPSVPVDVDDILATLERRTEQIECRLGWYDVLERLERLADEVRAVVHGSRVVGPPPADLQLQHLEDYLGVFVDGAGYARWDDVLTGRPA
jgi:hypothetical protein